MADIWGALGAALSQGGRTFGILTEQENEQKAREEALRQEKERYTAQQKFQQDQFAASQKERELARMRQSILDAPEGAQFDDAFVEQAKNSGYGHLFDTQTQVTGMGPSGAGGPFGFAMPDIQTKTSTTRHLSVQEKAAQAQAKAAEKARADAEAYRAALNDPKLTAQQRFELAERHGQKFGGLSPAEQEAKDKQEFAQAQRLAQIRTSDNGPRVPSFPSLVQSSLDNVRARLGQVGAGVSQQIKVLTDAGQPVPQELLDQQRKLSTFTEQDLLKMAVEQARGIMGAQQVAPPDAPGAGAGDPTSELIGSLDQAVRAFGGDFNKLKQSILQDQAALRAEGVDVPKYLAAIRSRVPRQPNIVGNQPSPVGFLKQTERFSK